MAQIRQQVSVPLSSDSNDDLVRRARDALNTFVVVEKCQSREPDPRLDFRAWREWHDGAYRPAHQRWARAMEGLEGLLNDRLPDQAAENWVSVCVRILSGELR